MIRHIYAVGNRVKLWIRYRDGQMLVYGTVLHHDLHHGFIQVQWDGGSHPTTLISTGDPDLSSCHLKEEK